MFGRRSRLLIVAFNAVKQVSRIGRPMKLLPKHVDVEFGSLVPLDGHKRRSLVSFRSANEQCETHLSALTSRSLKTPRKLRMPTRPARSVTEYGWRSLPATCGSAGWPGGTPSQAHGGRREAFGPAPRTVPPPSREKPGLRRSDGRRDGRSDRPPLKNLPSLETGFLAVLRAFRRYVWPCPAGSVARPPTRPSRSHLGGAVGWAGGGRGAWTVC